MIEQTISDVRGIIQRTYGDATQTVLDDRCARAIVAHLHHLGWASPAEVARVVAAAGGQVDVNEDVAVSDYTLETQEILYPPGQRLRARRLP